jgi:hypothetical protein
MSDVYLVLDNSGGKDIDLGYHDKLHLEFTVSGCFTNDDPDSFYPKLPNGYFTAGTKKGPYQPSKKDHDDHYDFEPNQQCKDGEEHHQAEHEHEKAEPEHRKKIIAMHTIHTGR